MRQLQSYMGAAMNIRDLLPYTLDVADLGLDTQLAVGTDLTSDLLDLSGKDRQLVNHSVDGVDQRQHLSGDRDTCDLAGQVTASDSSLPS